MADGTEGLRRGLAAAVSHLAAGRQSVRDMAGAAASEVQAARGELSAIQGLARPNAERLAERLMLLGQTVARSETVLGQAQDALQELAAALDDVYGRVRSAVQTRELGLSIIRAQEEERRRLAREIHDGPAQLLANVVLRIDVCQKLQQTAPDRVRDELGQLKELVRLSLQDVRKVIFDLRPMALDDLGLVPALRAFLKDFQARTSIETDFSFFGQDRRFDSAFEVALFRLVQEALTNVTKHARAARVWVKIEVIGGRTIKIVIRDDGVGFDIAAMLPESGSRFGLVGMRERTQMLGGDMQITSAPGEGTRLDFTFKLSE